ncbi:MAG: Sir2 family NAD-dependent protein deacetylase [bacterium]|nr:NAD-dependent deacetylase [Gammaproteobacteria bacterium]HIL96327.1 NAD-dependent deacetylase [Pseudomonadales bacterium]
MSEPEISSEELIAFRRLIRGASNIVIFTGAGISTESGIPDFRGPHGIWKSQTPIDFSDFVASEDVRRESWRRKFAGRGMDGAEPNSGHLAVAKLVRLGKVSHIITQNVDGLHQKSGVPDAQVIQLHGNANYATCLQCGKHYELADIRRIFSDNETIPYCTDCSGIIKTATISFGQAMPVAEMERAQQATLDCDLFIAIGSSLVVYPAAGFPRLAKQQGAGLVIVNNEVTDLDPVCDLVLHYPIGSTLSAAVD